MGHPWIYNNEVDRIAGTVAPGDIVEVYYFDGQLAGRGYINPGSQIIIRLLTRKRDTIDAAFFHQKISEAWAYRKQLGYTENCRLVFGEADGLPALIIDKFNDYKIKEQESIEKDKLKLNEREDRFEENKSAFSDKVAKFEHDSHIENQRINEEYVNIAERKAELKEEKSLIENKLAVKLLEVSGLTQIEAREIVLKNAEELNAMEIAKTIEETKIKIDLEKKNIAKDILLEAIENNCVETVNEVVLKQIKIPNNEDKGK